MAPKSDHKWCETTHIWPIHVSHLSHLTYHYILFGPPLLQLVIFGSHKNHSTPSLVHRSGHSSFSIFLLIWRNGWYGIQDTKNNSYWKKASSWSSWEAKFLVWLFEVAQETWPLETFHIDLTTLTVKVFINWLSGNYFKVNRKWNYLLKLSWLWKVCSKYANVDFLWMCCLNSCSDRNTLLVYV
jgi:hypothetical protein